MCVGRLQTPLEGVKCALEGSKPYHRRHIELIQVNEINEAFDRLEKGDVKYRFVANMASLKS